MNAWKARHASIHPTPRRRTTLPGWCIGLSLACGLAAAGPGAWAVPTADAGHRSQDALRLIDAVRQGRPDGVRQQAAAGLSIDACAPGDGTALIVAARQADPAMVGVLLDLGADVNGACEGDGNPLIAAAARGNVTTLARLLDAGARVDAIVPGDETALITAARKGRLEAVRLLASRGADLNLGAMTEDGQWRTPLNQAHDQAIARFLRSKGATPDGERHPPR